MREYSVPATFQIGASDTVVDAVYAHERDDPNHVILQRQTGAGWTDVTCAR